MFLGHGPILNLASTCGKKVPACLNEAGIQGPAPGMPLSSAGCGSRRVLTPLWAEDQLTQLLPPASLPPSLLPPSLPPSLLPSSLPPSCLPPSLTHSHSLNRTFSKTRTDIQQ
ncbi:unnamed protein product, partial [Pleuronectes platessa]